jgi:hypothetical protein
MVYMKFRFIWINLPTMANEVYNFAPHYRRKITAHTGTLRPVYIMQRRRKQTENECASEGDYKRNTELLQSILKYRCVLYL